MILSTLTQAVTYSMTVKNSNREASMWCVMNVRTSCTKSQLTSSNTSDTSYVMTDRPWWQALYRRRADYERSSHGLYYERKSVVAGDQGQNEMEKHCYWLRPTLICENGLRQNNCYYYDYLRHNCCTLHIVTALRIYLLRPILLYLLAYLILW